MFKKHVRVSLEHLSESDKIHSSNKEIGFSLKPTMFLCNVAGLFQLLILEPIEMRRELEKRCFI